MGKGLEKVEIELPCILDVMKTEIHPIAAEKQEILDRIIVNRRSRLEWHKRNKFVK